MSKLSSVPHLVKNDEVNVRVEMIQSLIPIALEAVADLLSHELDELAGPIYTRKASSVCHVEVVKVALSTRAARGSRSLCLVHATPS